MSTDVFREVTIDEDKKKQQALEFFSDNYTRVIIATMMEQPRSAIQISEQTGIPLTTVYRKLRPLLKNGIIRTSGEISENGKKSFLYKSKIKSLHVTFTKDKLAILANTSGTCKFCLNGH